RARRARNRPGRGRIPRGDAPRALPSARPVPVPRPAHRFRHRRAFEADLLAEVLDLDPLTLVEELEELCEQRLLEAEGDRFRFRYPLLREALRGSLTPARRRLLLARLQVVAPTRLAS